MCWLMLANFQFFSLLNLEIITVSLSPLVIQQQFAGIAMKVEDLFTALQERAFNGEL